MMRIAPSRELVAASRSVRALSDHEPLSIERIIETLPDPFVAGKVESLYRVLLAEKETA